jgi:cytochrome c-type biogenesis protein CcmH
MADAAVATRTAGPSRWGSRLSFVLALVVLGVALAIGAGVGSSSPPTDAQRAAAIEAQVRCPSCDDLSVAQSTASSALAVRHQILTEVEHGMSATGIENGLVAQYGSSILLSPPASGLSALVWYVPAVAGGLALCALVVFFWRRSRSWRALGHRGTANGSAP